MSDVFPVCEINVYERGNLVLEILEHGISPRLGGLGGNLPSRVMGGIKNALVDHGGKNLMKCPPRGSKSSGKPVG